MNIEFNDLGKQWDIIEQSCKPKIDSFLSSGKYIDEYLIEDFEDNFTRYCGSYGAVACSSGSTALMMAIDALDLQGDTVVLVQNNTYPVDAFIATKAKHELILMDCNIFGQVNNYTILDTLDNIDKVTNIVIIYTHMYGVPADIDIPYLKNYSKSKCINFYVIEDCSHAHGAKYKGRHVGNNSDIAIFSLYPSKNLGAAGNAGIAISNNPIYIERMKLWRHHGTKEKYTHILPGMNYNINSLQCIVLNEKLKYLDEWNNKKRLITEYYNKNLSIKSLMINSDFGVMAPYVYAGTYPNRDYLIKELRNLGVPIIIHYPNVISSLPMYKFYYHKNPNSERLSKTVFSLPLHPFMTDKEVKYIVKAVNSLV